MRRGLSGWCIGFVTAGVGIAVAAACQGKATAGASTTADATLAAKTRRVEIVDPRLHRVAYRMVIPSDWLFDGTVLHEAFGPTLVFRTSSRDGLIGLQNTPRYDWISTTDPGMRRFYSYQKTRMMSPMPAEQFLRTIALPEIRPNAEIGDTMPVRFRNRLRERDQQMNAQFEAEARANGGRPGHITSDASIIRVQYQFNGRPIDEALLALGTTADQPSRNGSGVTHISQIQVTGMRAPLGAFDDEKKRLTEIWNSIMPDSSWVTAENAYELQAAQHQQAADMAYAQQRLAQNRAIFEASMSAAAAMESARHQGAVATAHSMADVQPMGNPATGQTGNMSSQYNYSYADENGNVVQTNSATYNPSAELRGNWTQLQPVKP